VVSNLRCGSDYSFYLRAFNRLGEGQASQVIHVATNGSGTVPRSFCTKQLTTSRHLCQFTGLEATGRVCVCVCVCVCARADEKTVELGQLSGSFLAVPLSFYYIRTCFCFFAGKND